MQVEATDFKLAVALCITAIEDERRLHRRIVEFVVWGHLELVTLRQYGNRMCCVHCNMRSAAEDQPALVRGRAVVLELRLGDFSFVSVLLRREADTILISSTFMLWYLSLVMASSLAQIGTPLSGYNLKLSHSVDTAIACTSTTASWGRGRRTASSHRSPCCGA